MKISTISVQRPVFATVVSLLLVGVGWSVRAARYGAVWGLAAFLGVYSFGVLMAAAGHRNLPNSAEMWRPGAQLPMADLLLSTVQEQSAWSNLDPNAQPVTIAGIDSPALHWLLRDRPVELRLAAGEPGRQILQIGAAFRLFLARQPPDLRDQVVEGGQLLFTAIGLKGLRQDDPAFEPAALDPLIDDLAGSAFGSRRDLAHEEGGAGLLGLIAGRGQGQNGLPVGKFRAFSGDPLQQGFDVQDQPAPALVARDIGRRLPGGQVGHPCQGLGSGRFQGNVTAGHEQDAPLAGGEPFVQVHTAGKVGGGTAVGNLGATFHRDGQPAERYPLVGGDRRHGQCHSGAQCGGDQLQGAEPGARPVEKGALVGHKVAVAGGNRNPFVAQVGRCDAVDQH